MDNKKPTALSKTPLTIAAWVWLAGTLILTSVPLLTTYLLHKQYMSLINNTAKISEIIEFIDFTETTHKYTNITQNLTQILSYDFSKTPEWILVTAITAYSVFAVTSTLICALIATNTAKGVNWARIAGASLTAITVPAVTILWLFFLELSWIPLDVFVVNNLGIVIAAAYITGSILVFIPPANRYVKHKKLLRDQPLES